jgi:cullin-4
MRKYMEKNEKKSIKFVPAMTSAIVRFKRRDFVCSAAQALVLSLLNDSEDIERGVIFAETGLPESEVAKALTTLKESELLVEEKDGFFAVNSHYRPPAGTGRIELNQYQYRRPVGELGISDDERAQTEASAMEDRQHQVDAAIVRVMKKVRKCSPAVLYGEILNVTKFAFSKQEITKRVAALVDREFIEKDPGDDGEVRYLA